jgi:Zn-finger nucleic acid-binding protein
MNVVEAAHCMSCGTELGLMPVPAEAWDTLRCPRCPGSDLDAFYNGETTLHDCQGCGGQFVRNSDLAVMIQRHEARRVGLPTKLRKENPLSQAVTYVPCPVCKELMMRRNFGKISGIIVDVCTSHGTWFDTGELPRILAFVGSGGMEHSRACAAESKPQQARQRAALIEPSREASGNVDVIGLADVADAVREFVDWVRRSLR